MVVNEKGYGAEDGGNTSIYWKRMFFSRRTRSTRWTKGQNLECSAMSDERG